MTAPSPSGEIPTAAAVSVLDSVIECSPPHSAVSALVSVSHGQARVTAWATTGLHAEAHILAIGGTAWPEAVAEVAAAPLRHLLAAAPTASVAVTEAGGLTVATPGAETELHGTTRQASVLLEMPAPPPEAGQVVVSGDDLATVAAIAETHAAPNVTRPSLAGAKVGVSDAGVAIISTDGYRVFEALVPTIFSLMDTPTDPADPVNPVPLFAHGAPIRPPVGHDAVVPCKALTAACSGIGSGPVTVAVLPDGLYVASDDRRFRVTRQAGEYPDCKAHLAAVEAPAYTSCVMAAADARTALDGLSRIDDYGRMTLEIDPAARHLTMTAASDTGRGRRTVPVANIDGHRTRVDVATKMLAAALRIGEGNLTASIPAASRGDGRFAPVEIEAGSRRSWIMPIVTGDAAPAASDNSTTA